MKTKAGWAGAVRSKAGVSHGNSRWQRSRALWADDGSPAVGTLASADERHSLHKASRSLTRSALYLTPVCFIN